MEDDSNLERHRGKAMVMVTQNQRVKVLVECDRCGNMEVELHAAHLRSVAQTLLDMADRLELPAEHTKVKVVGVDVSPSSVESATELFKHVPVVGIDQLEETERELERTPDSVWGEGGKEE